MKRRLYAFLHLSIARPLEGWCILALGRSPAWTRRFAAWSKERMFWSAFAGIDGEG